MGLFFKSEYVIAMFNNKNSRLTSRILCIVGLEGQSSILLVGKVKKIKAFGLNMPIITLIFIFKKSPIFRIPCPNGEKVLILSISCPQQNTLLWPCYYGSIDNKRTSYTKLKLIKTKNGAECALCHFLA